MARKRNHSTPPKKSVFNFSKLMLIAKRTVLWVFATTIFWVLVLRFVNPPVTWLMLQRGIERKINGQNWKVEKKWRSFDSLSPNLKLAAMAGEDASFMRHWGFDLKSIQRAYEKNRSGKPMRGGSTITQQTAKNVFLWPGRSWIRKGFEVYFTALIEIIWGKKRILEVYLNVIEMGDGIYGAEAATQFYYQKPASRLSKREAALLISVLPNPLRWTPAQPSRYIYKRQRLILNNMRRIKRVNWN